MKEIKEPTKDQKPERMQQVYQNAEENHSLGWLKLINGKFENFKHAVPLRYLLHRINNKCCLDHDNENS